MAWGPLLTALLGPFTQAKGLGIVALRARAYGLWLGGQGLWPREINLCPRAKGPWEWNSGPFRPGALSGQQAWGPLHPLQLPRPMAWGLYKITSVEPIGPVFS